MPNPPPPVVPGADISLSPHQPQLQLWWRQRMRRRQRRRLQAVLLVPMRPCQVKRRVFCRRAAAALDEMAAPRAFAP